MKLQARIEKLDQDQHLVFGFASVTADENGNQIVDSQGDVIDIYELERAAYEYILNAGETGEMHENFGIGKIVESIVFTPEKLSALNLEGKLPSGWWIGMKITDEGIWEKIKNGAYKMFSIGGRAVRSEN